MGLVDDANLGVNITQPIQATRSLVLIWIAALWVFSLSGAIAHDSALSEFTDEQIVDYYVELAFGAEVMLPGSPFSAQEIIKRKPVRTVHLVALPQPTMSMSRAVSAVKKIADDIERRSGGIDIVTYDENTIVDYVARNKNGVLVDFQDSIFVFIGSEGELLESMEEKSKSDPIVKILYEAVIGLPPGSPYPVCVAGISQHPDSAQVIGAVVAWIEDGPDLEECLYEEIMQSFGIGNDFPAGTHSMFNDDRVYNRSTELDWLLWRIHTAPRIQAGMTAPVAIEAAREILKDLRSSQHGR